MSVVARSTSLFGSRAGTHQIRDQSRALEDGNDFNNSLEVYTPRLLYSPLLHQSVHGYSRHAQCNGHPK